MFTLGKSKAKEISKDDESPPTAPCSEIALKYDMHIFAYKQDFLLSFI